MKDIDGIEEVVAVLEPHWNEINQHFEQENKKYLEMFQADHDAIGRVLRAHLIIESFMGGFLVENYGIERFDELRLTFAQKARLLPSQHSSAAFVRPGVIQLNAVRNKFSHGLNYSIQAHDIGAIYSVLNVSRPNMRFDSPVDAIEAFTPIACAFLSIPKPEIQELFTKAFEALRSFNPENDELG